ncbi:MAG: type II toxin-antitoxin system RelE/ParE family toxin [Cyanobacteria bacterium HKST-UBA02]|nr:type II toxin-antitoxin system RelE/ParE family toxin [Cyanobacteria bacterium HKST-UBA02]
MPALKLVLFRDDDGSVPVLDFLEAQQTKVRLKTIARFELLEKMGSKLRRPHADYLDKGIYELRYRVNTVQYRFLYFFSGKDLVVVSHGFTKLDKVPKRDIELAKSRKKRFDTNPYRYSS